MNFWWRIFAINAFFVAVAAAIFAATPRWNELEHAAQKWECKGTCDSWKNQVRKIDI